MVVLTANSQAVLLGKQVLWHGFSQPTNGTMVRFMLAFLFLHLVF